MIKARLASFPPAGSHGDLLLYAKMGEEMITRIQQQKMARILAPKIEGARQNMEFSAPLIGSFKNFT